ncbi:hypothetical protein [Candidatus Avelusimicrobium faecicola]|uniref:hypothetical protein n=1 Tax=Candidatus Avelusimicrobium faecicola TaxID=3416205 RepID=UPI003D0CE9EF
MITTTEIAQYQSPTFDKQFATANKAGQIAWYPWVGKQYPTSACKVLVILESHYINWERNNIEALALPDFTRRIVAEQVFPQYRWNSRTFNNLAACLSGKVVCKGQISPVWEKVALYNFVQRPMDSPKERPDKKDFATGWKNFPTVVDIVQPDVCIFASMAVISNARKLEFPTHELGVETGERIGRVKIRKRFTVNTTPDFQTICVAIKHPGKSFAVDKWRAVLQRQVPQAMKILTLSH